MQTVPRTPELGKEIKIENWHLLNRGALVGTFDAVLPSGMVLHECGLFVKDGKRWIGPPSRKITLGTGTKYEPMVTFIDHTTSDKFRDLVTQALEKAGFFRRER